MCHLSIYANSMSIRFFFFKRIPYVCSFFPSLSLLVLKCGHLSRFFFKKKQQWASHSCSHNCDSFLNTFIPPLCCIVGPRVWLIIQGTPFSCTSSIWCVGGAKVWELLLLSARSDKNMSRYSIETFYPHLYHFVLSLFQRVKASAFIPPRNISKRSHFHASENLNA